jgi:hypothetical protein
MDSYPKLRTYKKLFNGKMQPYLRLDIPVKFRSLMANLRMSSHKLMIETGRFFNIKPEEIICPIFKTGVEDEIHFFLECIQYKEQRDDFLKYCENMDLNK